MPKSGTMDLGRRRFLSGAGGTAAGTTLAFGSLAPARAAQLARVAYPGRRLASLDDLSKNETIAIAYPDDDAPGILVKLGERVAGGVGPDGDIVGFSTVCPHKGYPLTYQPSDRSLKCPGHYSLFDCEKGGQQIWGHATQNLPQYKLRVDAAGDIYADGIDELLYGRLSNVLGG